MFIKEIRFSLPSPKIIEMLYSAFKSTRILSVGSGNVFIESMLRFIGMDIIATDPGMDVENLTARDAINKYSDAKVIMIN